MSGCTSVLGADEGHGHLGDAGEAEGRRARPRPGHVAAVPADPDRRPHPHRPLHAPCPLSKEVDHAFVASLVLAARCRSARPRRGLVALSRMPGSARAVSLAGELQQYSLAVPTEKEGATTTKIVLTVPDGFSIDSFTPSPGWQRAGAADGLRRGRGDPEGHVDAAATSPTGEDSTFWFLGAAGEERHLHVPGRSRPTRTARSSTGRAPSRPRTRRRRSRRRARSAAAATRRSRSSRSSLGAIGVVLGGVALFAGGGKRAARMSAVGRRASSSALVAAGRARAAGRRVGARLPDEDVPVGERDARHAAADVALTFDEAVEPRFAIISVTDKDAHPVRPGRSRGRRRTPTRWSSR